nr:MAG TPA: hypothetical protein [Caudoviricetes sp.]
MKERKKTENKGKNIEYHPYMCYNNYNNISSTAPF